MQWGFHPTKLAQSPNLVFLLHFCRLLNLQLEPCAFVSGEQLVTSQNAIIMKADFDLLPWPRPALLLISENCSNIIPVFERAIIMRSESIRAGVISNRDKICMKTAQVVGNDSPLIWTTQKKLELINRVPFQVPLNAESISPSLPKRLVSFHQDLD